MPGYAEIALKVTANVRDAVRGIETVDKAIERTDKRLRAMSERTRASVQRGVGVARGLASGQSLESTVTGLLPATGPLALAAEFAFIVRQKLDQYFDQKIAQARRSILEATSSEEAAAGFQRETTAGRNEAFKNILSRGALPGAVRAVRGLFGESERDRAAKRTFRDLARTEPARAANILANLPPDLESLRGEFEQIFREEQQQTTAREAFRATLQPTPSNATVVNEITNVYSSFSGLGGESTVGREVRAVLDRRDRNNGRYVTPYTRR